MCEKWPRWLIYSFQIMKCNVCKLLTQCIIISEWDQCLEFWSFKARLMEAISLLCHKISPQVSFFCLLSKVVNCLTQRSRAGYVQRAISFVVSEYCTRFWHWSWIFLPQRAVTQAMIFCIELYMEELLSQKRISVLQEEKRLSQLSWIWPKA